MKDFLDKIKKIFGEKIVPACKQFGAKVVPFVVANNRVDENYLDQIKRKYGIR